jgi:Uma2 family endonuclease
MATQPQVSPEEYLATAYEPPDPEFVRGGLIPRGMPDFVHGMVQARLAGIVLSLAEHHRLFPAIAVRLRLAYDLVRVPDISVFRDSVAAELVPTSPPHAIIEIVSRDDRHIELLQKLDEYHRWGVPHVWLVDPWLEKLSVYDGDLRAIDRLQFPGTDRAITIGELVADLKPYPV